MQTEDMNEGVRILLARMESNPEDFLNTTKWLFVQDVLEKPEKLFFLTAEEILALQTGMRELYRNKFTKTVLEKLTGSGQGELF